MRDNEKYDHLFRTWAKQWYSAGNDVVRILYERRGGANPDLFFRAETEMSQWLSGAGRTNDLAAARVLL